MTCGVASAEVDKVTAAAATAVRIATAASASCQRRGRNRRRGARSSTSAVGVGGGRSRARRDSVHRCGARRRLEGRVVAEDRLLEPLQCLARLDAEVVDERAARLGVGVERLRLPVGAVEGEHLLRAEPFPQRVLAHEQVQLAENLFVPAEREVAVDPVHQRRQPQLVELRHLVAAERLEQEPARVGPRQSASASCSSS